MIRNLIRNSLCIGLSIISLNVFAQGSPDYGSGLKLNIDKDGSKYIRFIFWNQIWMRSMENNPGTLVNGRAENTTFDIGARRLRFLAIAQISPRYLILSHVGINNQTFATGGASGTTGTGGYGQGKKVNQYFVIKALQLYLEGVSYREIERILGVSHVSVMNWVKQYALKKPVNTEYHPTYRILKHHELVEYLQNQENMKGAGMMLTELGDKYMLIKWERFKEK